MEAVLRHPLVEMVLRHQLSLPPLDASLDVAEEQLEEGCVQDAHARRLLAVGLAAAIAHPVSRSVCIFVLHGLGVVNEAVTSSSTIASTLALLVLFCGSHFWLEAGRHLCLVHLVVHRVVGGLLHIHGQGGGDLCGAAGGLDRVVVQGGLLVDRPLSIHEPVVQLCEHQVGRVGPGLGCCLSPRLVADRAQAVTQQALCVGIVPQVRFDSVVLRLFTHQHLGRIVQ
mmetsp:Transcript_53913/g.135492  ORF Transcript_53913/g.135492 Transcript_53913/m.135492 type:complete len:226 (-) Transcript_53913:211-888(-)